MEHFLVIGVRLNDRLQEQLDKCIPAYHMYFKDNNPEFLQVVTINGERILGKRLKPGTPISMLDDYAANVRSILHKICPEYRVSESEIKLYAQTLIG
jgi:hypothetical protein